MGKAWKVCSTPTCPALVPAGVSRCEDCTTEAEQRRGTAHSRGYGGRHRTFRKRVLERDPICMVCQIAPSTVADHYPLSRRDLVSAGLDPNDPARGRGLCAPCHGRETAVHQPGGWNSRT